VTVGFDDAGWFGVLKCDCAGLLVGLLCWDCVAEGERLPEEEVRAGDLMGLEVVNEAAAVLELGLVLAGQVDAQIVAPLQLRSEAEGQQPPRSIVNQSYILVVVGGLMGTKKTNHRKIQILLSTQEEYSRVGSGLLSRR
jgi:hypothetical protein